MVIQIDYFKQSQLASSDISISNFALAQDIARDAVLTGAAERTEIRDEAGSLLFHYPRVMHSANRT